NRETRDGDRARHEENNNKEIEVSSGVSGHCVEHLATSSTETTLNTGCQLVYPSTFGPGTAADALKADFKNSVPATSGTLEFQSTTTVASMLAGLDKIVNIHRLGLNFAAQCSYNRGWTATSTRIPTSKAAPGEPQERLEFLDRSNSRPNWMALIQVDMGSRHFCRGKHDWNGLALNAAVGATLQLIMWHLVEEEVDIELVGVPTMGIILEQEDDGGTDTLA
ncbi:hypothetical protein pipiens_013992, partial [Culex pipiens pipiens]